MRLSGWMLLAVLCSAAAGAQERGQDAYLDAQPAPPAASALRDRVESAVKKAVAESIAAEPAPSPLAQQRLDAQAFSAARTDAIMTAAFNDAKVPDCLHADGLKRQPTFFLGGYLALPFIAVAALRGVCH
ncbi:hypothetical protein FHW58_000422 [Duganella sp. 1224]|uniref:hypothetical protein n=1 Tax=Duganella sp. 1224 TaxID=2587052 RepID=UPI0015CEC5E8|nr:hypothetical protein [Duganella sp. 1224]NYE59270.1 hypothetical protein [Duganella sp. 1224]